MRRQAFDVLVVGPTEREFLLVTKADAVAYGEVLEVKEVPLSLAGSGANVAVGLARLGLKVGLVTALGRDALGDQLLKELSTEGVETGLSTRVSLAETGLAVTIFRERGGEPLVVRSRGANDLLEVTEEVQTMLHTTRWLYLAPLAGAGGTLAGMLLETLRQEQTRVAWAPGMEQLANHPLANQLLERSAVLFVTGETAKELSGRSGAHDVLEGALVSRGAETVCLSLPRGDIHVRAEALHLRAAVPQKTVVDPRGGEDALRAGFLAGLIRSDGDPAAALQWGVTNAGSVVATYTAQRGLLTKSVLEERLRTGAPAIEKSTPRP